MPALVDPRDRRPGPLARLRRGARRALRTRRSSARRAPVTAPQLRDPVKVNRILRRDFIGAAAPADIGVDARDRATPRALYISSPIGLGHAQPDVAIADELRQLVPRPRDRLARAGPGDARARGARASAIHPASAELASESAHIESESAEHDLHCFQALAADGRDPRRELHGLPRRRARPSRTTCGSATRLGSSTTSCTRTRSSRRAAYCWLTDFVGWLPMPDGGEREASLTADYNAEMIEHIARYPRAARPGDLRRQPRRHRPGRASDPGCRRSATGPSSTSTSPAT